MHKLQFITHTNSRYSYYESAEMALKSGVRWIQLRMKDVPQDIFLQEAVKIKALCEAYQAVFSVNDHPEIALQVNADGIHLGKMDMHPAKAREILGKDIIIGGTANSFEDILKLHAAGVDYIGLGPFRFTQTKQNLSPVLGVEGYKNIVEQCVKHQIEIPILAIGGITPQDIPAILAAGVYGIALSSVLLDAEDPQKTTQEIVKLLEASVAAPFKKNEF